MSRSRIHLIPVLALFFLMASTVAVHAWSFMSGKYSAPFNQCMTCHISNANLAMNPYGDDFMDPTHQAKYAQKHPDIPVTGDCNNCHSGKGYPIVRSGLDSMDSDLDLFSNQAEFAAGTFPGDATDFPLDASAPTVTAFSLPAVSSTLTVAVTRFTASDDVAVTGYLLNESGVDPPADDAGWQVTAPTRYTFFAAGVNTLYAWAKDAAGNVSAAASAQVDTTPSQDRVNEPPVASAGPDQAVVEGETVIINGGGSSDDLGIFNYAWLQLDGPGGSAIDATDPAAVVISDPFDVQISFVTPPVGVNGATLTFQLTVTDGDGAQGGTEIRVTVDDNGITAFDGMPGVVSTYAAGGQPIGIGNTGANACTRVVPLGAQDVGGGSQQPNDPLYGFLDFELRVIDPAGPSVTIYLPSPAPAGYKWYKYTDAAGWFDFSRDLIGDGSGDGAVFNADRTQVTIYITDNGDFDDDPTPQVISDPGGLAAGLSSSISVGSNNFGSSGGGCFINAATAAIEWLRFFKSMAAPLFVFLAAGGFILLVRRQME
ncbi:choice-of-anchor U domain-containing protein [Desulfosarcina sp.]|uniref:choice-of-anchor U domain-containing protein n=1 Tax=Desulfosarcina sp. TaxID=2027861 RepID=UPI0039704E97